VENNNVPYVKSVFHLTDFSEASDKAFDHALAIALYRKAKLTILHVAERSLTRKEWAQFPSVRMILQRWKVLGPDATDSDLLEKFGIEVKRVDLLFDNPEKAIREYLKVSPSDILVLAFDRENMLLEWIKPSLVEVLARKTHTKTLFVPSDATPFISHETGDVKIQRILVPVDSSPDPAQVIEYARRTAKAYGAEGKTTITLLHVGEEWESPEIIQDGDDGLVWEKISRKGKIAHEILAFAREQNVDLIMMATHGHHGILDIFRGNISKQVLRDALCPILTVPS
jgi:nucleotide-binding universal stress UspA family protein